MSEIVFSCVIPCSAKDFESQKLKDLISSIKAQDFPQDKIEILTITEGDSEQAKGIGIRRAKGEICAMFCADNMLTDSNLFKTVFERWKNGSKAIFTYSYDWVKSDNSLNRYFSLIGGNDPVCYYLGKNDRSPWVESLKIRNHNYLPSHGCNGTFYDTETIRKTDLDNYYPMDNALETNIDFDAIYSWGIWHRTSDNLITFLTKRYKYARDLYSNRANRRWKILDTREDYWRLLFFIFSTITIAPSVFVSIRGFSRLRDWAWAWHWPVCVGFLITYGVLTLRNIFVRLLSRRWADLNPFAPLSKA